MPVIVIHCTCPDRASADAIARALVSERLAACVQQVPDLRSTYLWDGRIEQSEEVLLLIKTAASRLGDVTARVQALHPYELPELVALEAHGGSSAYLDWVEARSRADD